MNSNYPKGIEVVGAPIIENSDGKILFSLSTKWGDKWVLPGGHVEPGETIFQAVVREGEEETGLALRAIEVINSGELIDSKEFNRPAHLIFFHVYTQVIGGEVTLDEKELHEFTWVFPEEALKLNLGEGFYETIQKFINYKDSNK